MQAAVQKRAARKMRFGLEKSPARLDQGEKEGSIQRREARAKRFGTKLVATGGEPIKLIKR